MNHVGIKMRTLIGDIILPPDIPNIKFADILIEVRDISEADAPSLLIKEKKLHKVELKPNGQIQFKINVPQVDANRALSIRVHISKDGNNGVNVGDLLTTSIIPIPSTGTLHEIKVPVIVI